MTRYSKMSFTLIPLRERLNECDEKSIPLRFSHDPTFSINLMKDAFRGTCSLVDVWTQHVTGHASCKRPLCSAVEIEIRRIAFLLCCTITLPHDVHTNALGSQ